MKALVVADKRKVLVKDDHPTRITAIIPTAKIVNYKGTDLVVVHHGLEETKVLRNFGFDIPSPIGTQYTWPIGYTDWTPFHAQRVTADMLTTNDRMYVLNEIGTSKTLSTLWAYDYLRSIGHAKRALVITPLSTLERVWADEVYTHLTHLDTSVLYGSRQRRIDLLENEADIYIVNHDGIEIIEDALKNRPDIDTIIIDELAVYRNAGTDRFKAVKRVCDSRKRVWGLTGTPTPNGPTDAWAQCRLVNPSRVPKYFGAFRDMVERKVTQFKWVPRDNALDVVRDAMQPAVLFRRDECIDLPPTMYEHRYVEMSAEQKKAYKQMMSTLVADAKEGRIVAVNAAVKAAKLSQVACGVAYDEQGQNVYFDCGNRIKELREIIEQSAGKVIVFVPLTGGLEMIAKELSKTWECAVVYGDVGKSERDAIFGAFKRPGGLHVLIAHPRCMAHGLSLVLANTIVWFIPTNSNDEYEQANGRITRPGQTKSTFIVHLEGSEIERRMYKRLKDKGSTQAMLLDMIKEEFNEK